jgi:hypothetical protein
LTDKEEYHEHGETCRLIDAAIADAMMAIDDDDAMMAIDDAGDCRGDTAGNFDIGGACDGNRTGNSSSDSDSSDSSSDDDDDDSNSACAGIGSETLTSLAAATDSSNGSSLSINTALPPSQRVSATQLQQEPAEQQPSPHTGLTPHVRRMGVQGIS